MKRRTYLMPVRMSDVLEIYRDTSRSHREKLAEAVDFLFVKDDGDFSVEGRPVFAAAKGVVFRIQSESTAGGPLKRFWFAGNYISIRHGHNEYTHYEHLKPQGVLVRNGQRVSAGQLIGYSGNTGYTLLSHLHFERFRYDGTGEHETLPVRFRDSSI